MDREEHAVRFSSLEWTSPQPKVRAKARQLGARRLRLVEFRHGMEHPEWCTVGHVGYVLEGRLAIQFDDQTIELKPGDGLIIPEGEASRHRPAPLTDHVLVLLSEVVKQ